MEVKLTAAEVSIAAQVGCRRNIEAMVKGLKPKHGFKGSNWDIHIEGACGEMAFAKALGLYWDGSVNTFKYGGDVGRFQIRTRSESHYQLIVRNDDDDDAIFWLVTGKCPQYNVVGCIEGRKAKCLQYSATYGNRPPAYFVPNEQLTSTETFLQRGRDG